MKPTVSVRRIFLLIQRNLLLPTLTGRFDQKGGKKGYPEGSRALLVLGSNVAKSLKFKTPEALKNASCHHSKCATCHPRKALSALKVQQLTRIFPKKWKLKDSENLEVISKYKKVQKTGDHRVESYRIGVAHNSHHWEAQSWTATCPFTSSPLPGQSVESTCPLHICQLALQSHLPGCYPGKFIDPYYLINNLTIQKSENNGKKIIDR